MNKNLFALVILLSSLFFFGACSEDKDEIDEEWKAYNEDLVREAIASGKYRERSSFSGNGSVYWRYTDFFEEKKEATPKITQSGTPYSTDSVVVRYEGWYFLEDGTKVIFDTTEGGANKQSGIGFRISGLDSDGNFTGVIDGWITMLINMKEGEAVEFCVPYRLGYGASGNYDGYGYQTIPGYTTLWFNMKLLRIIPDNPDEYVK